VSKPARSNDGAKLRCRNQAENGGVITRAGSQTPANAQKRG